MTDREELIEEAAEAFGGLTSPTYGAAPEWERAEVYEGVTRVLTVFEKAQGEPTDAQVLDASKRIHAIECGCPYDGEHTEADIERRDQIARAVLETKTSASSGSQKLAVAKALCAAENAGEASWGMVSEEQREWYLSQAEVALIAAGGLR